MFAPLHKLWLVACAILGSGLFLVSDLSAQINLPAIDPSGNRIFLPAPNSTNLVNPFHANSSSGLANRLLHHNQNGTSVNASPAGFAQDWAKGLSDVTPAFTHPNQAPSCNGSSCAGNSKHLIPRIALPPKPGEAGQIILTPARIIAPVGSEVVVLAGLCGGDGHFVINQPLEWMLSNDSVGQIIEVGGMEHSNFNRMVPPQSKKFDGQYAWGRTGLKEKTVTRGTPTPVDDIDIVKGQTYISVSSASPGTSYITCVAPNATGWDKRRATTIIHWVDGLWSIPLPVKTTSGTVQPLSTMVSRVADGSGIPGWKVRYTIIDGAPAEFVPTGSQQAEVETSSSGVATVQLRQQAGKLEPGTTSVRVDVVRPSVAGEQELIVESGVTCVTWSSPALTITAKGPESAPLNQAFNYRIEVNNPGDQVARGVQVSTEDFGDDVKFISSNPKPAEYGKRLQWDLGDINPGESPKYIDIQLSSDSRGIKRSCFTVESQTDRLSTQACAETEIAAPCLGLQITGDTEGVVGRQARYDIVIVNQCNEPLENVNLQVDSEPGLSVAQSGNQISYNAGRLEFGESRTVPVIFDLTQPGTHCFQLTVIADGGHTARAKRCIEISQAALGSASIRVEGDRVVQVNNFAEATAKITNNGNTPLKNILILNKFSPALVPVGFTGLPAENQSKIGDDLAFRIDTLYPGESIDLLVRYEAKQPDGDAFSLFSMVEPVQVEDRLPIRIGGGGDGAGQPGSGNGDIRVPSDQEGGLTIEFRPDNVSIPADRQSRGNVGFRVTNTRSTPISNVRVSILVPPGLELVALPANQNDLRYANSVEEQHFFEVCRELRPGESLNFFGEVVGARPGQMGFQVRVESDNTLGTITSQNPVHVTPLGN